MPFSFLATAFLLLFTSITASATEESWEDRRSALGNTEKYRILVDKVLSRGEDFTNSTDWILQPEHFKEIRDAGFNVVSPRIGGADPARIRRDAQHSAEAGLFYLPWIRATVRSVTGTRLVWPNGQEQNLLSPNSDELWEKLSATILEHARISTEFPSLLGSFLDFENYEDDLPDQAQYFCYPLSFDKWIFNEFNSSMGRPNLNISQASRAAWIELKGLVGPFRDFQVNHWRRKCRNLRENIDAINPDFRLLVYPAEGSPFLEEAVYKEWGTERAPLALAAFKTYGRRGWINREEALTKNRDTVTETLSLLRGKATFHHYLGGIDPLTTGADPEFCGKNASMLAEFGDGYWVFYEGPTYGREDHTQYFDWFARANQEIESGTIELWKQPRQEPDHLKAAVALNLDPNLRRIAVLGLRHDLGRKLEETKKYDVHWVKSPAYEYLKQFDAVVLQEYRLPYDDPWAADLRKYVEGGGGLLLLHEVGEGFNYLFPELIETDSSLKDSDTRGVIGSGRVVLSEMNCGKDLEEPLGGNALDQFLSLVGWISGR